VNWKARDGIESLPTWFSIMAISRRKTIRPNYHVFRPLLYQVATGSLSLREIASLHVVWSGVKNSSFSRVLPALWKNNAAANRTAVHYKQQPDATNCQVALGIT
jgi:NADH dehydrogenase FAD-containing subunit